MKTNRHSENFRFGAGKITLISLRFSQWQLSVKSLFDGTIFTSIEKLPIIYANIRV